MRIPRAIALLAPAFVLVAGCGGSPSSDTGGAATARPRAHRSLFSQPPLVGVACRRASSIRCDRVGIAVWLREPTDGVEVTVAGRRVVLRRSGWGPWLGYLHPAGLLNGALGVRPDRGRFSWQGKHPRNVRVHVVVRDAHGAPQRASVTVPLRPGWG